MSGVAIMRALLTAHAPLAALVEDDNIVAEALPENTQLNGIVLTHISGTDRNIPLPGARRRVTERVQVNALGKTYPEAKEIVKMARKAAADKILADLSEYEGFDDLDLTDIVVHTSVQGPDDYNEDAAIHIASQDFLVGFNEPT
jgi:hypothetical protein